MHKWRDNITPILADLHWLPVSLRIDFKISLLGFIASNDQAPAFICDLLTEIFQCVSVSLYMSLALSSVISRDFLKTTQGEVVNWLTRLGEAVEYVLACSMCFHT